ncbi:uncharacterized protein PV09_03405 [Verruconis gallopava]|uniref:M protein, serotype 2.1 n=1 Tax=Verruconis gallopava TaxID=253628 RepID=A0A0D2B2P2_9PEZI|nr:uncharacterized protein PV09_03405 [Verruconis gallopava]KIW05524.1 hypothetical protein PV09_03405 [Verruconis gallopava]
MATAPKKTPTSGTSGRNSPGNTPTSPSPAPRRTGTGAAPSTPSNGVARARSVRTANGTPVSARAMVKKPAGSSDLKNSTSAVGSADEDARMESSALIDDLKDKLQRAEQAAEDYKKQVEVLQSRLDEAIQEQGKLEDRLHEEEERVEGLENERREVLRQKREIETIYETERAAAMKEREATQAREEELQSIIQRLKESLSQKDNKSGTDDGRMPRAASSPTLETGFAPPSSLQRSNSRNNSKLILQKDQLIESLRLELAELQIKMVEMENMGDATRRVHELERTVLEQRMTNARLMEDIDSYQLLLSERTLNGDFSRNDLLRSSPAPEDRSQSHEPASLADELASNASEDGETTAEHAEVKKLMNEISTLKNENKALTLYINKIIDRILQHQGGYENILSNTDDEPPAGAQKPAPPNKDKDLPPPPPAKDTGPSLLQRASSVVYGRSDKSKPRPQSTVIQTREPGVTEDISTAPSIPLNRTNSKRVTVDFSSRRRSTQIDYNPATVVGNMYRGPTNDPNPASPSIVSPRNSFFGFRQPSGNATTVTSIREDGGVDDSTDEDLAVANRKSALDALNGTDGSPRRSAQSPSKKRDSSATNTTDGVPSVDTPSPPRSMASRDERSAGAGGVMTGNKMRPLRLVKEAEDEKKANRSSWSVPQNITQSISGWWNKDASSSKDTSGGS